MDNTQTKSDALLLDCREAAKRLGISQRTLWAATKVGDVAHVRIGRRVLYCPADLTAWISRNRRGGQQALN